MYIFWIHGTIYKYIIKIKILISTISITYYVVNIKRSSIFKYRQSTLMKFILSSKASLNEKFPNFHNFQTVRIESERRNHFFFFSS